MSKKNFYHEIGNDNPFAKVAWFGMAGSGKTYNNCHLAIGLHSLIKSKKPIGWFDTERSSKFSKKWFDEAGINVMVRSSRTLADLVEFQKDAREGMFDIILVDSLSHVWDDLVESYKRSKNRNYLTIQDWGVLKSTWRKSWATPFVNEPYHYLFAARAGFEYETTEEEDDRGRKRKEVHKSGVKMRSDVETAYEADYIFYCERHEELLEAAGRKKVFRITTVLKDRSTLIDGKQFVNLTFDQIRPAVEDLLLNPMKVKQEPEHDTAAVIDTGDYRTINLEEIEGLLTRNFSKKADKVALLEDTFGTSSWTKIKGMDVSILSAGLTNLKKLIGQRLEEESAS